MVDFDSVDGIVQHAHHSPREVYRLTILIGIPSSTANLFAAIHQSAHIHFRLPPSPAPVLVRATGFSNLILWPRELCNLPGLPRIQRDLCTDDLVTSACVRVAAYLQCLWQFLHLHKGVVARLKHGRVDVHVIDDVLGLVPPAFCMGQIGIHMRWKNTIVEVVIVVFRWFV